MHQSDAPESRAAFHTALLEAQREARDIQPDQVHPYHGYPYGSSGHVQRTCREVLLKHGFTVVFGIEGFADIEGETKKGETQWNTTVQGFAVVTHAASGWQERFPFAGRAMNESDKGVHHAYTGMMKGFLMDLLRVSVHGEPSEDTKQKAQRQKASRRGKGRRGPAPAGEDGQEKGETFKKVGGSWFSERTGDEVSSCPDCRGPARMTEGLLRCVNVRHCGWEGDESGKRGRSDQHPALLEEIRRFRKSHRVEPYEYRALLKMMNVEEKPELQSVEDLEKIVELVKRSPSAWSAAAKKMGEAEPVHVDVVTALQDLEKQVAARNPLLQARVKQAIASNWHDAVVEIHRELEALANNAGG